MNNQQNNTNENVKLINRLTAKFHNSQILKKIAGLALAGAITISLTACDYDLTIKPDNSETEIKIEGTFTTPTQQTTTAQTTSSSQDLDEYSDLLKQVVADEYYHSLLVQGSLDYSFHSSAYFKPHPYTFLEDEGYNIEAIKNGSLTCETQSFIKESEPNNLYIATYVENKGSTPYFTEYLIKYKLTDQEVYDYNFLHDGNYIQSVFMNDKISQLKTPTIVSKTYCEVNTRNQIKTELSKLNSVKGKVKGNFSDYILTEFNIDENTFDIIAYSGQFEDFKATAHVINLKCQSAVFLDELKEPYALNAPDVRFACPDRLNSATAEKISIYQCLNMRGFAFFEIENNQD